MKKFYTLLISLAVFGWSISAMAQITGDYKGTANVLCTAFSIDETYNDVVVTLETAGSNYCLEVAEIEGSLLPPFKFCDVTATPVGTNYTLSAPPIYDTIPEITIPAYPPYFPVPTTVYNVPVKIELTDGLVEDNILTLKAKATAKLLSGLVTIPVFLDYNGKKMGPFEGDGDETNPYLIYTPKQLKKLSDLITTENMTYATKYYKLMNDIDLVDYQDGEGWIPIGKPGGMTFRGYFNGNNKVITGMKIKGSSFQYLGLFGLVMGGTVENLGIENAEIASNHSIFYGEMFVGGITGFTNGGTIKNCYTTGEWKGYIAQKAQHTKMGGIVGAVMGVAVITNCYSEMELVGEGSGTFRVGGIVGEIAISSTCVVSNCYSTGNVAGAAEAVFAGGIVGSAYPGLLLNCYAIGEISAFGTTEAYSGGIVGDQNGGSITNCAALNPRIDCAGTIEKYGRVLGNISSVKLENNVAFKRMLNPGDTIFWDNIGLDKTDGEDISAQEIYDDKTIDGRFDFPNWTTEKGKLPGLFGNTVEMPLHLRLTMAQTPVITLQPEDATVIINTLLTLNVTATVDDGGALTYQWFTNTTPNNTGGTAITAATDSTYTPETDVEGTFYYYVEITNTVPDNGNGGMLSATIASNPVTVKVGTEGVEPITNDELRIMVFPNPTSGQLTIDNGQLTINNVEIFDIMGKKQFSIFNFRFSIEKIDISNLANGIYLLKITTETGIVTKKVIKH